MSARTRQGHFPIQILFGLLVLTIISGCSLKRIAMNEVANTLADTGTSFASDDDPELVREAIPFTLKLVEAVLAENPRHKKLLTAAASYFTQYAYGFIQLEADYIEMEDYERAEWMRKRAQKLFLRAREYGLARLELDRPGIRNELAQNPRSTTSELKHHLAPTLYWTAAAWGSAITLGKNDPFLISQIPQMEALIDRALELDPDWNLGAIQSFLISYEMSRSLSGQDPEQQARVRFADAVEASEGKLLSPYVSLAEAVSLQNQDAEEFQFLLNEALAIEIDEYPSLRLVNLLTKKRALWLLSQMDELFLLDENFEFDE